MTLGPNVAGSSDLRWKWIIGAVGQLLVLLVAAAAVFLLLVGADAGTMSPERALKELRGDSGIRRPDARRLPAAGLYLCVAG